MNIVLAGATGNIGSRILDEALRRSHRVTGLTRDPARLAARHGLLAKKANTADVAAFADALKGHDAAILSVKWNENDVHQVLDALHLELPSPLARAAHERAHVCLAEAAVHHRVVLAIQQPPHARQDVAGDAAVYQLGNVQRAGVRPLPRRVVHKAAEGIGAAVPQVMPAA